MDFPPEIADTSSQHAITAFGADRMPAFLLATQAHMNDAKGKTRKLRVFSKAFVKLNRFHASTDLEQLELLRDIFFTGATGLSAKRNSLREKLWNGYVEAGALTKNRSNVWDVTPYGQTCAPFLLDRVSYNQSRLLN